MQSLGYANITDDINNKQFNLSYDELLNLLKYAYRNGYTVYENADAGLEPYDSEGYARWVMLGLSPNVKKPTSSQTK
jgi:hypothetical protein